MPERLSLRALTEAAQACRGCELHRDATQAVMGAGREWCASFRVGEARGLLRPWPSGREPPIGVPRWVLATSHPSAVLRSRSRDEDYVALVRDLRVAAEALVG